jgi:cell division protein FtsB
MSTYQDFLKNYIRTNEQLGVISDLKEKIKKLELENQALIRRIEKLENKH